jgi:rubredoxin
VTCTCAYSLTHSPTHPLTHSPTHPLTHSPTHPLTHPLTRSLTHSLTHPPTHSGRVCGDCGYVIRCRHYKPDSQAEGFDTFKRTKRFADLPKEWYCPKEHCYSSKGNFKPSTSHLSPLDIALFTTMLNRRTRGQLLTLKLGYSIL